MGKQMVRVAMNTSNFLGQTSLCKSSIAQSRMCCIGEIEDERLLSALEKLKEEDLKILTLYAYDGYTVTEIYKVLRCSQPTISIKIKRITKFLKNFEFDAMD